MLQDCAKNAFVFTSANAAFALAIAFDCPVVDAFAFALAFALDSPASAIAFVFFQMHLIGIKCETNANEMRTK